MKSWSEIGASLKTTQVIVSSLITLIGVTSSLLVLHKNSSIKSYLEKNPTITKTEVDNIVQERIAPVVLQMTTVITNQNNLFDNQQLMKSGLITHMKLEKTSENYDQIIDILSKFKNDIITEIKKNNPDTLRHSFIYEKIKK